MQRPIFISYGFKLSQTGLVCINRSWRLLNVDGLDSSEDRTRYHIGCRRSWFHLFHMWNIDLIIKSGLWSFCYSGVSRDTKDRSSSLYRCPMQTAQSCSDCVYRQKYGYLWTISKSHTRYTDAALKVECPIFTKTNFRSWPSSRRSWVGV